MATDLVIHENALDGDFLIRLAEEIAQDLNELDVVLQKHGITADAWAEINVNPFFTKVLEAAQAIWGSPLNAAERTKVKAAILTEQALPTLDRRVHDANEPLDKVIQGIKLLSTIAGLGEKAQPGGLGSTDKFIIQINMGAGTEAYVKDKEPIEAQIGDTPRITNDTRRA